MATPKSTAFRDVDALRDSGAKVLQAVFGVSGTTISNRTEIFVKVPGRRGHYDLIQSAQNYLAWLRGEKSHGEVQGERGKLYEEQRRKLELQNRTAAGELIEIDAAKAIVSEMSSTLRAGLVALPGRLANQVAGINKPAEARALLNGEIEELLNAIEAIATEGFSDNGKASAGNGTGAANSKAKSKP